MPQHGSAQCPKLPATVRRRVPTHATAGLKSGAGPADIEPVSDDLVWTFEREGERLEIRRHHDGEGMRLTVTRGDEPHSYGFRDAMELINFQSDMEALLVQTGWTFVAFSPEHRAGQDRRTWPRMTERRRWWTDGLRAAPEARTKKAR
jgi:hypothetical protein